MPSSECRVTDEEVLKEGKLFIDMYKTPYAYCCKLCRTHVWRTRERECELIPWIMRFFTTQRKCLVFVFHNQPGTQHKAKPNRSALPSFLPSSMSSSGTHPQPYNTASKHLLLLSPWPTGSLSMRASWSASSSTAFRK